MAVHKLKKIGKGKTSKQFMGDPFELGRSGPESAGGSSTRPKGKSWCGGGKSKGKNSKKDDY